MATYYVDATGGSNTADGLTTATAWQTLSQVNTAALAAGDFVYFKKGEKWREKLTAPQSGSAGAYITFTAYGSGANPIFDGSDVMTGTWTQSGTTNAWYLASSTDPILVWEDSAAMIPKTAIAVVEATANTFCYVTANVYIHASDSSDPNTSGMVYEMGMRSETFDDGSASYVVYDGIDSQHTVGGLATYGGIKLSGGNNIAKNFVTTEHWRHGVGFAAGAKHCTVSSFTATNSYSTSPIYAYGGGSSGATTSDAFILGTVTNTSVLAVGNCVNLHGAASDILFSQCSFNGGSTGESTVYVYDAGSVSNRITRSILFGTGAGLVYISSDGDNCQIDYCVLDATVINRSASHVNNAIRVFDATGTKIYNNVFFGDSTEPAIRQLVSATGTKVKNNIFCTVYSMTRVDASSVTDTEYDYNCLNGHSGEFGIWSDTAHATFALWKTNSGQDSHSMEADPLFVDFASADYALQSGSPCRNAGTDVGITADYAGKTVPFDSVPEIGAYEYYGYDLTGGITVGGVSLKGPFRTGRVLVGGIEVGGVLLGGSVGRISASTAFGCVYYLGRRWLKDRKKRRSINSIDVVRPNQPYGL